MSLETILLAVGVWVAMTVAGLALVAIVVASLPVDYFSTTGSSRRAPGALWRRVGCNVAGAILILLGLVLSIPGGPGQGVLTVLAGVILVDFPGRARMARALARRRGVLATLNRLRAYLGRPPLLAAGPDDDRVRRA